MKQLPAPRLKAIGPVRAYPKGCFTGARMIWSRREGFESLQMKPYSAPACFLALSPTILLATAPLPCLSVTQVVAAVIALTPRVLSHLDPCSILQYMEKCRQQRDVLDRAARARKSLETKRFNEKQVRACPQVQRRERFFRRRVNY